MPTAKRQVKRETRVGKIGSSETVVRTQLNGLGVAARSTSRMLPKSATPAAISPEGVHTPVCGQGLQQQNRTYVPVYVGGTSKERISLHSLEDGKRLCRNANPSDCKFLAFNTWKTRSGAPPHG
jgi:hypothetical protein